MTESGTRWQWNLIGIRSGVVWTWSATFWTYRKVPTRSWNSLEICTLEEPITSRDDSINIFQNLEFTCQKYYWFVPFICNFADFLLACFTWQYQCYRRQRKCSPSTLVFVDKNNTNCNQQIEMIYCKTLIIRLTLFSRGHFQWCIHEAIVSRFAIFSSKILMEGIIDGILVSCSLL